MHHAHIARAKLTLAEVHRALGHISQKAVLQVARDQLVEGPDVDLTSPTEFCEACAKSKAARQPFPQESKPYALTHEKFAHTGLWGSAQTASLGETTCYISFTDDYTCETKVEFLKAKSEALEAFKRYKAHLSRQSPDLQLQKVRSDRGGECLRAEFGWYLLDQGIER
jgi:hypothetical protein